MSNIRINVSRPYDVIVERGSINHISQYVESVCKTNRIAIITDDIVNSIYGNHIKMELNLAGLEVYKYVLKNGETSKSMPVLSDILEFLAINHFRRNDLIIALGGGVVGDVTGLSAALYMRGINFIQIPTTLLAMVDSSVGGKTAIDLINGKNMAGSFWQPVLVICDPHIAEILPENIFAEGMAEIIKYDVIKNMHIIDKIQCGLLKEHLQETIELCIKLKRDIVEKDEFDEKGIRNILNVGHTVAHAIEKLSNYSISHGMAVGTGLIVEAQIAKSIGVCAEETVTAITEVVNAYNLFIDIPWSKESIVAAMKSDKKNRDSKIVFELPCCLGRCEEYKISKEELRRLLDI